MDGTGAVDLAGGFMVHVMVIVMAEGVAVPDGIVMVHGMVMPSGILMPDGIGMLHDIDIMVVEDRRMVQPGDPLNGPAGLGDAFAATAGAVRHIAAARAAAAVRRERIVVSSAGRGPDDRVRGSGSG